MKQIKAAENPVACSFKSKMETAREMAKQIGETVSLLHTQG
jgi:hypothetical protein